MMNIKHLKEGRFLVESKSKPKTYHEVDLIHLSCDCIAFKYRKICSHIRLAASGNFETEPVFDNKLFERTKPEKEFTYMKLFDGEYCLVNNWR